MDQIHLSPLVDQIQLALGHISNSSRLQSMEYFLQIQYHHSRINFLATSQECANAPATLFFAECSKHGTGTKCWCAPVSLPHPDAGKYALVLCLTAIYELLVTNY
jgi:hypothetical protein